MKGSVLMLESVQVLFTSYRQRDLSKLSYLEKIPSNNVITNKDISHPLKTHFLAECPPD